MSIIKIKEHGESIYNLIKKPLPPQTKAEFYTSRFRPQIKDDSISNKRAHLTFGVAQVPAKNPSEFLKKHTRVVQSRPVADGHVCLKQERLPPIPPPIKKGEDNAQPPEEAKDFCGLNVIYATRLVPRQPKKNIAHTRVGDLLRLEESGLEPKFARKKTYGKTPEYIGKRKLKEKEQVCMENVRKERENKAQYVSSFERDELLEGLKKNWELKQRDYQLLPMMTDTISKVNNKLKLEAELKQMEHDIQTIQRHTKIYVVNKSED